MKRCFKERVPQLAPGSLHHDQRGITLAETLIAISIISLTFVVLLSALSTGSIAARVYAEGVSATGVARSQMEHSQNAPYVPPPHTYPSISTPPRYSVTSEAQDFNGSLDLEKIVVTVYLDGEVAKVLEDLKVNQ